MTSGTPLGQKIQMLSQFSTIELLVFPVDRLCDIREAICEQKVQTRFFGFWFLTNLKPKSLNPNFVFFWIFGFEVFWFWFSTNLKLKV